MNNLGLYFGPKAIDVVITKGKKLFGYAQIPQQAVIPDNGLEEKVPSETRSIEVATLIKDILRREKSDAKEVVVCLSGKDLIVRTFEIPDIPKDEIGSAINFEAKKYIPFKIEDLISDYQLEFDKISRTNTALFIGIKKETFDKYISLVNRLGLKVAGIEYSGFSILRSVSLSSPVTSGVSAVICVDSKGEDEVNFVVLENNFPLFSRDIALGIGEVDVLSQGAESLSETTLLDKLKSEVRVSLDYYRRKFPDKNIQRIFIICSQDIRPQLEGFMGELGLNFNFVDVAKLVGKPIQYSSSLTKGFSASLFRSMPAKIKINLLEVKKQVPKLKGQISTSSLLKGFKLDLRIIILGILICGLSFGYGYYKIIPLKQEFSALQENRAKIAKINLDVPREELNRVNSEYKNKLDDLERLIKKQLNLTEPLGFIQRAIPEGAWLNNFYFKNNELNFSGMVYLEDKKEEFDAVNLFVSNLKSNIKFSNFFNNIEVNSIDRGQFKDKPVTIFNISCKLKGER